MLRFELQKTGPGHVLLNASGSMTLGQDTAALRDCLQALVGQYTEIILDMSGVTKLDSSGVGTLVAAYAEGRAHGTVIRLVNLTRRDWDLLLLMKLLTVFEVAETQPSKAA